MFRKKNKLALFNTQFSPPICMFVPFVSICLSCISLPLSSHHFFQISLRLCILINPISHFSRFSKFISSLPISLL